MQALACMFHKARWSYCSSRALLHCMAVLQCRAYHILYYTDLAPIQSELAKRTRSNAWEQVACIEFNTCTRVWWLGNACLVNWNYYLNIPWSGFQINMNLMNKACNQLSIVLFKSTYGFPNFTYAFIINSHIHKRPNLIPDFVFVCQYLLYTTWLWCKSVLARNMRNIE